MSKEFSLLEHIKTATSTENGSGSVKNPDNLSLQEIVDIVKGYKIVKQPNGSKEIVSTSSSK